MNWQVLLTSTITSATVTAILTYILKTYFRVRVEHFYRVELEKCKSELSVQLRQSQAFVSRRVEGYPALVEMIYRTRNMARDLSKNISSKHLSLVAELTSRAKELEELLYKYRIDLERDDYFKTVHDYKNVLLTFTMRAADVKYFLEHAEDERADRARDDLQNMFSQLEELYEHNVHNLSLTKAVAAKSQTRHEASLGSPI